MLTGIPMVFMLSALHLPVLSLPCQSIPDRIAARPDSKRVDPIEMYPIRELMLIPLEEVIAAGDLVVEGTVHPLRTYLSDDRCTLLTDYAVTVSQVHFGPGQKTETLVSGPPLIVTTTGGETTVDGVRVMVRDAQLPPFTPGQHVLLFLSRNVEGTNQTYGLAKGVYGAFAVENGRVKHMLQSAGSAKFDDMDKASLIAKLKRQ